MMRFLTAKDETVPNANCEKCPLYGQPIVDSFGNPDAKIIFVGEAPGATEVQRGEPFVGRAGQLLNRALQEAGLKREDCYFTNACLCRPEENATPKKPAVDACRPRVHEEIKEHNPTVVVPLGAVALRSVAKKMSINQWHGSVEYSDELKTFIVPTYHPAAVLRNLRLYPVFLADLQKAVDVLKGTYKIPATVANVTYTVVNSTETFSLLTEKLNEQPEVALDIETASDGRLLCIGLSWEAGHSYIIPAELLKNKSILEKLNSVFKTINLVGHNLKFDIQGLWKAGLTNARTWADTMLEHYLLNEIPGTHGLKQLAREFLNAPEYDNPVKPFYKTGFENCDPEVLYQYNASDATYTYQLHKLLQSKLSNKQKNLLNTILIPASNVLARAEYLGAHVDTDLLNNFSEKFNQVMHLMHERMKTILGRDFNPNSTKELVKILYDELDLPIPFKKSTDEEHLKMLRPYSKFVSYLLAYRKLKKLESTYARGLLNATDEHGRVHTNFNLHGTVSGRLSSSKPTNLQNIPKKGAIRNIFTATPGYVLVEGDQKQAEVRGLAWYSQDPELINTIVSGVDMHVRTASLMFGIKPEDVNKVQRQAAKRITFGIIYGMSAETLAQDLGISVAEAEENIDRFFGAYNRAREWIHDIQNFVLNHGYVETPFGRIRHFGYITNENKSEILRQAVNTPIQSLASDITLMALIEAGRQLEGNEDTRLILTVHDSILLETKEDPVEVGRWLHDIMSRPVLDGTVPFEADVGIGQAWGSLKEIEI